MGSHREGGIPRKLGAQVRRVPAALPVSVSGSRATVPGLQPLLGAGRTAESGLAQCLQADRGVCPRPCGPRPVPTPTCSPGAGVGCSVRLVSKVSGGGPWAPHRASVPRGRDAGEASSACRGVWALAYVAFSLPVGSVGVSNYIYFHKLELRFI